MTVIREEIFKAVDVLLKATRSNTDKRILNELNVDFKIIDDGEVWRDIEVYDGDYQISKTGKVRSQKSGEWRPLKRFLNRGGYEAVILSKNDTPRKFLVHVLVARAFVPNPENKPEVNHIDGNKMNNCAWNLEWVTRSENLRHATRTGLMRYKRGTNNGNARLTEDDVHYIREKYIPKHPEFGASALSRKFHVNIKTVLRVIRHESYKDVN